MDTSRFYLTIVLSLTCGYLVCRILLYVYHGNIKHNKNRYITFLCCFMWFVKTRINIIISHTFVVCALGVISCFLERYLFFIVTIYALFNWCWQLVFRMYSFITCQDLHVGGNVEICQSAQHRFSGKLSPC